MTDERIVSTLFEEYGEDSREEVEGILNNFIQSWLPEKQKEINELFQSGNWGDLSKSIHAVKGTAGGFGYMVLTDLAKLIENKLIEKNEVKVSHEEVVEHTKGLLAQQMASMGMPTNNDEELTETANRVLQNQEEAKNIYMMMYDQKLMDVYKSSFKLKEKEVSYEEFVKIVSK